MDRPGFRPADGSRSAAFDWQNVGLGNLGQSGLNVLYSNAALRIVVGSGAFAGNYDANGSLIYRVVDGLGQVLTYDAENRMTQVQTVAGTASFVYNGDGAGVVLDEHLLVRPGARPLVAGASNRKIPIFPKSPLHIFITTSFYTP